MAVQVALGAQDLAAARLGVGLDVAARAGEAGLLWDKKCFLARWPC